MLARGGSSTGADSLIELPATRNIVDAGVGLLFFCVGLPTLLAVPDSLPALLGGTVFVVFGASQFLWTMWGRESVMFGNGRMRVEARLWGRRLVSREFDLARVSALRIDTSVYGIWNTLHSPSGLPARLDLSNPPVRFNYDGRKYALGDGLDEDGQSELVEAIRSAVEVAGGGMPPVRQA